MSTYSQQQLHDKYCPPSRSNINIEKMDADLGLSQHYLTKLYADFIFCEYVDVNEGLDFKDGLYECKTASNVWRKARVLMIADAIKDRCEEKIGDIIIFPSDKGLKTGEVAYKDQETGEVKTTKYGFFINEPRIFGQVEKNEQ